MRRSLGPPPSAPCHSPVRSDRRAKYAGSRHGCRDNNAGVAPAKRDTPAGLVGEGADIGHHFMEIAHRQTNKRNLLKACLSAAGKRL